jgi:uncharacterized protein YyaL (SSP411 family)
MTESTESENRLARTESPYLLQHADNPVDWYPWGDEAFERARELDRPVFLSIGYSTCHWCHVMAHESFEDDEVADVLNRHFVAVKVDREERPDVDKVYMTVCQLMTGSGGWPLTVVTTPDRRPFFAGTYFPKRGRGGRPGLLDILGRTVELWESDREGLLESARRTSRVLADLETGEAGDLLAEDDLAEAYRTLDRSYDEVQGGFGSAPKFPTPHNLYFLLRWADRTGDRRAVEMVDGTLESMRRGGIWDHVGFGFHRYATDARWLVPHFEKMLYDQALLALAYLEAWQVTGDRRHARTAREILDYVLRDLADPGGGFHAAEDADSEAGEGAYYVWSVDELAEVLDEDELALTKGVYHVSREGNYLDEATGERTGKNILHRRGPLAEEARDRGMEDEELRDRLAGIRERLLAAREERERPHRDDKVLTDWNGLVIAALARAGALLADEGDGLDGDGGGARYLEAARVCADFLLETMRDDDGGLLHRYRRGEVGVPANAADYAYLVWGLLELHGATFEVRWLREARRLQDELVEWCWDEAEGGFFFAGAGEASELPSRQKDVQDGALPSSNAVALWNELRLARLTGEVERDERAEALERAFAGRVREAPAGYTAFLVGVDFRLGPRREVVLAGEPDDPELRAMVEAVRSSFRPRTVALMRGSDGAELAEVAPFTSEQAPIGGEATAYVCRDFACERPVRSAAALRDRLDEP